jgi:hypothetical protein
MGWKCERRVPYPLPMNDTLALAPAGWLEALVESEAQLAAGQIVDGDEVMRELDKCIAQLEAKQATGRHRKATARR